MTLFVFTDSPDIAEQVFPFFGQEARNPVFCGKDDMVYNLGIGGQADRLLFNPFGVGLDIILLFHGFHPWLFAFIPFGDSGG
jgi:hypothetical protein